MKNELIIREQNKIVIIRKKYIQELVHIPKRIYEGFTCVTLTSNFTPTYIQPEEYYVKMVNGDKFFWQKINIIKLKIGSKRNKK